MSFTGKNTLTTNQIITNNGFWPDLVISDLLNQYRIPSEYADETIKTGLLLAMARINKQLHDVKTAMQQAGYASLVAFYTAHSEKIGGVEITEMNYKAAVFCRAKAFLLKQFNTLNRKAEAENAAKESDDTETFWLNQSQQSLFDLVSAITSVTQTANMTRSNANVYVALL